MTFNNKELKEKIPSLKIESSFGVRTDISENIQYFSHDKCGYLSGNYITICSIKDKCQYFYSTNINHGEITSFSIDEKNEIILIVIAQKKKGEKNLITLKIINKNELGNDTGIIKEIKIFPEIEVSSDYFSSISINITRGLIFSFFGPKVPGVLLLNYDSKSQMVKIIGGEKLNSTFNYKQVIINPYNPNLIGVIGETSLTLLQMYENDKQIQNKIEISSNSNFNEFKEMSLNFVTFAWINKTRLCIINSNCDLLILDFLKKFDSPSRKLFKGISLFETQSKAKSVFSKNGNIYIIKDDGYTLKLSIKSEDPKQILYEKVQGPKFISSLPRLEVHTVSVNNPVNQMGNSSGVLISTESGQIYHIDITKDTSLYDGLNFRNLICEFHSDEIIHIDIAKLKPLIATIGKDRYLRIWNYSTNQLELKSEQFTEDLSKIAFHPNGLHIAVNFKDRCKIMNITDNKIIFYKEIIINSSLDIKFSNYGHFLAICQKNSFIIYDFYTLEVKFNSKQLETFHTEDITCLVWDPNPYLPDFYFATCGLDGRAFYWYINNKEYPLYEYINKEKKFRCVNFFKNSDPQNEQLIFYLMDESSIIEVEGFPILKEGGKILHTKEDGRRESKIQIKQILKEDYINQFYYDQETKLMITSNSREHSPTIRIFKLDGRDDSQIIYQSNSTGVNSFKITHNLSHLFTIGRDKCLLIFKINGILKIDKREETFENDLILKDKKELDYEKEQLRVKLKGIEDEIIKDKEKAEKEKNELLIEISNYENQINYDEERFRSEMKGLSSQIEYKIMEYENEINEKRDIYDEKIEILNREHQINKLNKIREEEKETENIQKTINIHTTTENKLIKQNQSEINKIKQEYEEKIIKIKSITKSKEVIKEKLDKELKSKKESMINDNDDDICKKRYELEKLRIEYNKIDNEYNKSKTKLEDKVKELKNEIKKKEDEKNKEKNDLLESINHNDKYVKEIKELSVERKDKEQTIIEKQIVERELFKENQELEKFKFVLNYKIKELQHEKDPKENKLQQLEKQAKDMDREIKNFEFSQRNYLIELTTNNEIMNLYKKQIAKCEQQILKNKKYIKLFKQALYQSSLRATTYKSLKKRIIELKRWFLDIDYIEELEKTSDDSDYEKQRDFLEENNKNNKEKIRSTQKLFGQDHQKLMRENMNLIRIVNELERELHEIDIRDNENSENFKLKDFNKNKIKVPLPSINNGGVSSLGQKEKELKRELLEIEKKIQMIPLLKRKDKRDKEEKDKKEKKEKKESERKELRNRSSDN